MIYKGTVELNIGGTIGTITGNMLISYTNMEGFIYLVVNLTLRNIITLCLSVNVFLSFFLTFQFVSLFLRSLRVALLLRSAYF